MPNMTDMLKPTWVLHLQKFPTFSINMMVKRSLSPLTVCLHLWDFPFTVLLESTIKKISLSSRTGDPRTTNSRRASREEKAYQLHPLLPHYSQKKKQPERDVQ
jgi:hypothetical protein